MTSISRPQKYLWAAHAGALVLITSIAAHALDMPDFFKGLSLGILLALIVILFRSRLRDEYIERLWNAGTAAAFLAALLCTLGVELVRGFADPATDVFATPPLFVPLEVGGLTLAAFFAAFHVEMLRTRA